jgi:hypothetical protein
MFEQPVNSMPMQTLALHLGPLKYLLLAYDKWSAMVLDDIDRHIDAPAPDNTHQRIIHLVTDERSPRRPEELPAHLHSYLPADKIATNWHHQESRIHLFWQSPDCSDVFWSPTTDENLGPLRFHLPWGLIISDLVRCGGGLVHAGLACQGRSGLLFLAPPGGGKTTTLQTAPSDWQVLSDDAALIWPDDDGIWFTSPLPAWGNMIRPEETWIYPDMSLDKACRLKGLLVLEKAETIIMEELSSSSLTPELYRAMCEYPATITSEAIYHEAFFRTAAAISRQLPVWRLSLPRHGNIWPLLAREAA